MCVCVWVGGGMGVGEKDFCDVICLQRMGDGFKGMEQVCVAVGTM